jgi:hypothetical protein
VRVEVVGWRVKELVCRRRKKPESKVMRRVAKRVVIETGEPPTGEELGGKQVRPGM